MAVSLQSAQRARAARKVASGVRREIRKNKAAVSLQAVERGRKAREVTSSVREERDLMYANAAATSVQVLHRNCGWLEAMPLEIMRTLLSTLQTDRVAPQGPDHRNVVCHSLSCVVALPHQRS